MTDNRRLWDHLLTTGHIRVQRSALFDTQPTPLPPSLPWERVEGMLLGLAIGDALGNTSESQNPAERRAGYGEIHDYLRNRYADGRAVGLPSDDTQLTFWTLEQMLADDGIQPECIAGRRNAGVSMLSLRAGALDCWAALARMTMGVSSLCSTRRERGGGKIDGFYCGRQVGRTSESATHR